MEAATGSSLLVLGVALYLGAVAWLRRGRVRWRLRRSLAMLLGAALLAVALLPPLADHDGDFTVHVAQHLLLGMVAPVFLALSAPLTLVLRVSRPSQRRVLVRILHSAPARALTHPVTAAVLSMGGLGLLYGTGLYAQAARHQWVHILVHLHFVVGGYLFTAAIIGLDPRKHQPSMLLRCTVLIAAFGTHDTIAKLLYAHGPSGWRTGARLMWYGGDAADVLLLVVLFAQWYGREGRRLDRGRRTAQTEQNGFLSRS
ncbi:MAG: hypothetical protein NVSMB29_11050 [Candidatus Dormibacteria bacterium]